MMCEKCDNEVTTFDIAVTVARSILWRFCSMKCLYTYIMIMGAGKE